MGPFQNRGAIDVTKRADVFAAVDEAEKHAPIDVLVNNAGICSVETSFLDITEDEWNHIFNVNLTGMFHVAQAICRYMVKRRRGVVLNMSSKNGIDGEIGYTHYNASKGGIIMFTRTMALELAHLGIRVNAVAPGYTVTPMSQAIDSPEFVRDFVERYIPLKRTATVEDITGIFLFLASNDAAWITGQVFIVDGGQLAGQNPSEELLKRIVKF